MARPVDHIRQTSSELHAWLTTDPLPAPPSPVFEVPSVSADPSNPLVPAQVTGRTSVVVKAKRRR
ncbi:hypothetical protein [Streptomyces yerevanensis]|uniref:hypothetical protein n=1 Tax=Streptomyces yerevanensis TaxID=66378 RepID=UPI000A9EA1A6|nr:hypothetical protein [Streptomyces yerevanensis]